MSPEEIEKAFEDWINPLGPGVLLTPSTDLAHEGFKAGAKAERDLVLAEMEEYSQRLHRSYAGHPIAQEVAERFLSKVVNLEKNNEK